MNTIDPAPVPEGMETTAEQIAELQMMGGERYGRHGLAIDAVLRDRDRALAEIARLTAALRLVVESTKMHPDVKEVVDAALLPEEGMETTALLDPAWVKAEVVRDEPPTEERIAYIRDLAMQCIAQVEERLDRALTEIERLTAEQARVPPDRERLYTRLIEQAEWADGYVPTVGALLREAAAALRSPADGWREGAEAMREACAKIARDLAEMVNDGPNIQYTPARTFAHAAIRDIEEAIRALDIPSPPAADGWRTIESAPTGNSDVLLFVPNDTTQSVHLGGRRKDYWRSYGQGMVEPTHWMPLPSPPAEERT